MAIRALAFSIASLLTATLLTAAPVEASWQGVAQRAPTATPTPSAIALSPATLNAVTIEGTVRDPDGTKLGGVTVSMVPTCGQNLDAAESASSDSLGHYSVAVPPGRYFIQAGLTGYTQADFPVFQAGAGPTGVTQDVVLRPDDAAISGSVVDGATGAPSTGRVVVQLEQDISGSIDQTGQAANTVANADGTYTLSAASGTYTYLSTYEVLDQTPQGAYTARSTRQTQPYTVTTSNTTPVVLVLPSLKVETPGCAAPICTLGVSGDGWLPLGVLRLTLYQCNDVQCNTFTTTSTVGSVTADDNGRVNASVSFDAPPEGSYQLLVSDHDRRASTEHDVQTVATYVVTAQGQ